MEYIELHYILQELEQFDESKIQKIYHEGDTFVFSLYKSGVGKKNLVLKVPYGAMLVDSRPSLENSMLGMRLRKYMGGGIIRSFSLLGYERILKMVITTSSSEYHVYVELFSKGNVVICNSEDEIIMPWRSQSYSARLLKKKEQYALPPARDHVLDMETFDMLEIEKNVSYTLSKKGLGKKYAIEACVRAGVDGSAESVDSRERAALFSAVQSLVTDDMVAAVVSGEVEPYTMQSIVGDRVPYPDVSSAMYSLIEWPKKVSASEKAMGKVEVIVHAQRKALERLDEKARVAQRKGEVLYEKYELIKELLEAGKSGEENVLIVSRDPAKKKIVVDLSLVD